MMSVAAPTLPTAALTAIWQAIADELEAKMPQILAGSGDMSSGSAGVALLYASLYKATANPRYADLARELIDHALQSLDTTRFELYGGSPGIAWSAQAVDQLLGEPIYDELLTDFDEAMLAEMQVKPEWHGHFDVISGLAGIGAYGVMRAQRGSEAGLGIAQWAIAHLQSMATFDEVGCYWVTHRSMSPSAALFNEMGRSSVIDLGVAHGSPGVVVVLARAMKLPALREQVHPLLKSAADWLLAQEQVGQPQLFPHTAGQPAVSRCAWCYGDVSVAIGLIAVSDGLQDSRYSKVASRALLRTAQRHIDTMWFRDAALCHGSVGVAHILMCAAKKLQSAPLREAAIHLYAETVQRIDNGTAYDSRLSARQPLTSYLEGSLGVALACLAATADIGNAWEFPLMLFETAEPEGVP